MRRDRISLPPELRQLHNAGLSKIGGARGLFTSLPGLSFSWQSQARQYPKRLAAGLHHFTGDQLEPAGPSTTDCLLYYDKHQRLRGILNHYRRAHPDTGEEPGDFIVMVHPGFQRQGIGTLLLTEALRRWPDIDLERQKYTEAGVRLALRVRADGS